MQACQEPLEQNATELLLGWRGIFWKPWQCTVIHSSYGSHLNYAEKKIITIFLKLFSIFLKILSFFTSGNTAALRMWYPLQTVRRCLCVPECLKGVAMKLQDRMKRWLQPRFAPDITAVMRLVEACPGFVQILYSFEKLPHSPGCQHQHLFYSFLPCLSLLWAGWQHCWATGWAMLYQQVKKVVGDCCVSLTYRSSSFSEVEEAELSLSTMQKVPSMLAVFWRPPRRYRRAAPHSPQRVPFSGPNRHTTAFRSVLSTHSTFQQGCSLFCCHCWANHRGAY